MKQFELKIEYRNGEVDDYYTRLTGKGWESFATNADAALEEMKENDQDTFADLDQNDNVVTYWAEEIEGSGTTPSSKDMLMRANNLLGLTQKDFGTYIGVSIRTVNSWMTGDRTAPDHVAEMALRLAEVDSRALEDGERTTGMYRWAVISSSGIDEFLTVCGSKADALRAAEDDWKHLTPREKEKLERFEVGLIHVCLTDAMGYDGRFSYFEDSAGRVDGDVYECAKDYLD